MDVYGLFGFGKVYFCLVYSFLLVRSGCVRIFRVGLCLFPPSSLGLLPCLLAGWLACQQAGLPLAVPLPPCLPASLPPCLPASLARLLACVRACLLACWLSLLKWVLGGLAALPSSLAGLLACWLASCRSTFEDRFLKKKGESGKKTWKFRSPFQMPRYGHEVFIRDFTSSRNVVNQGTRVGSYPVGTMGHACVYR